MRFRLVITALFLVTAAVPAVERAAAEADDKPLAPLLDNLGTLHRKVTTSSPQAQRFFDQGLRLVYGFNHTEALRAFREAARLDPDCAMAYWGEALALGPNINDPMPPDREREAYAAIQEAVARKAGASEAEQAYIDALAVRFDADPTDDPKRRAARDAAVVEAMKRLHARYPDDPDAATIYAAAIMETMPWDYWTKDGQPRPGTLDVISILESVMARHPKHPGAHHYYIHIVEASDSPDRAVPSADVLESLMPGAGHLVHMPAHIYIRVGRYADAVTSNQRAIAADEDYLAQCQAQGLYPVGYYPHNIHFLWSAASLDGEGELALDAARKTAAKAHHQLAAQVPPIENFMVTPLYAFVRFGRWQEILTEPAPPANLRFANGIWHYARGVAFAARRDPDRAEQELAALDRIRKELEGGTAQMGGLNNPFPVILNVAALTLRGELAAARKQDDAAIEALREAVRTQDAMNYNEPADWHYPVRHSLGAVLLEAGRAAEAEAVYREDLARNRDNGWSLFGLAKSLRAQGKEAAAAEADARFKQVWARADVTLTASRF